MDGQTNASLIWGLRCFLTLFWLNCIPILYFSFYHCWPSNIKTLEVCRTGFPEADVQHMLEYVKFNLCNLEKQWEMVLETSNRESDKCGKMFYWVILLTLEKKDFLCQWSSIISLPELCHLLTTGIESDFIFTSCILLKGHKVITRDRSYDKPTCFCFFEAVV